MTEIIKRIIEIDKKAVQSVQEAEEKKAQMLADIDRDKETIYEDYHQRAERRISKMKEQSQEESGQQVENLEKRFAAAEKQLEQIYQEKKDTWVQQLYERCLAE